MNFASGPVRDVPSRHLDGCLLELAAAILGRSGGRTMCTQCFYDAHDVPSAFGGPGDHSDGFIYRLYTVYIKFKSMFS